jgi:hypothetical protein
VDLMLSKAVKGAAAGLRHLVVELTRPSVVLGQAELGQITNYAIAVAKDPAFKAPNVTWDFWLVGDDYDGYIEEMVHQDTRPIGVVSQKHPYTVRVRRWAEIGTVASAATGGDVPRRGVSAWCVPVSLGESMPAGVGRALLHLATTQTGVLHQSP